MDETQYGIIILSILIIIIIHYYGCSSSTFVPLNIPDIPDIPSVSEKPKDPTDLNIPTTFIGNVLSQDSRYEYPLNPPVNPIVNQSVVENIIPVPNELNTNELVYSGGTNQLLKIPLQMNDPNLNEQLRSQNVLITPYNEIKYSTTC